MGIIRLLLAICVVLTHSYPFFGYVQLSGELAVQAFFVISGFYMTLILREKYIGKNGSYFLFLSNRLLRIFPIYWLVLLVTLLLSFIWFHLGLHSGFDSFNAFYQAHSTHNPLFYASPGDIIKDFTILGRTDYAVLNDAAKNMTVPQAWTLVLELLFYSIAPFIVRKPMIVISLLFAGISLRYFVFHFALIHHMPLPYRFFPSEFMFFMLGSLAYFLYRKVASMSLRHTAVRTITLLFVALTVTYGYLPIDIHIRWFHLKDIYYSLLLAAAIPFIFLFTQHNKIDRYLGELSYPVYLSHTIVIVALANTHIQTINANVFTALAVLGTIAVSVLIVRYFDQPIEKWRQARVRATAQLSGWHQCLVEGQKQSRVGHERVFSNS